MTFSISIDKVLQIAGKKMQAEGIDEVEQEILYELLVSIDFNSDEVAGVIAQQFSAEKDLTEAELELFVAVLLEELKAVIKLDN